MSRIFCVLLALLWILGCSSNEAGSGVGPDSKTMTLDEAEGAVCGMVVKRQPAPRARVDHRNGTRLYFCGITDLLIHLDTPSPHGEPVAVSVEAMEIHEDPLEVHYGPHDWIDAKTAVFRIGDKRPPHIMGEPVMVYRDRATAERAVSHGETEILDFDALRARSRE